jgi:cobyrinic acid a,c-diamide synthase
VLEIKEKDTYMAFNVKRGKGIVDNKDGICYKNVLAAYTHLHAIGTPEWADGLVGCAIKYKKGAEGSRGQGVK